MLPWPFDETGTPSSGSNSVSSLRRRSSSARTIPNRRWRQAAWAKARRLLLERLEVLARGVVAVDSDAERPEAEVLGHRGRHAGHDGRARGRAGAPARRRRRTSRRSPCAARGPAAGQAGPARDELAEQLHVVVARAEHALVERLLRGPRRPPPRPLPARRSVVSEAPCGGSVTADERRSRVRLVDGLTPPGALPRAHPPPRRQPVRVLAGPVGAEAGDPRLLPPAPARHRARARTAA